MEFEGATYFCVQVPDGWLLVQSTALTLCPKCPFPMHANTCVAWLLREMVVADEEVWSFHLVSSLWSLWHKNAAPKVVGQTVLLLGLRGFLGKMMWAEWENRWETAPHHRALALQVHSSCLEVWNNLCATEEIRIYSDKMMQIAGGPSSDCSLEILAGLYPSWWSWGFAVFPLAGEHPQN